MFGVLLRLWLPPIPCRFVAANSTVVFLRMSLSKAGELVWYMYIAEGVDSLQVSRFDILLPPLLAWGFPEQSDPPCLAPWQGPADWS